jgi:hypothetical protein
MSTMSKRPARGNGSDCSTLCCLGADRNAAGGGTMHCPAAPASSCTLDGRGSKVFLPRLVEPNLLSADMTSPSALVAPRPKRFGPDSARNFSKRTPFQMGEFGEPVVAGGVRSVARYSVLAAFSGNLSPFFSRTPSLVFFSSVAMLAVVIERSTSAPALTLL